MADNNEHKLCTSGCGFFGNSTFDGMCSVCFKKSGKVAKSAEKPETPKNTSTSAASLTDSMNNLKLDNATKPNVVEVVATPAPKIEPKKLDFGNTPDKSAAEQEKTEETEKRSEGACASVSATSEETKTPEESKEVKKPKKNRCQTCKKKVGLLGFKC